MASAWEPTEDEILRRKLLFDGDSGDDKRIMTLLKNVLKWLENNEQSEIECEYQKLLSDLSRCEHSFFKGRMVYDMNIAEKERYAKLDTEIQNQIAEAVETLNLCKEELEQAKILRKNRQEYDALAKIIKEYPDRDSTTEMLNTVSKDLEELKRIETILDEKLDMRRKQFKVLVTTAHNLKAILEEDDAASSVFDGGVDQPDTEMIVIDEHISDSKDEKDTDSVIPQTQA